MFPKKKRVVDKKLLKSLRNTPCVVCFKTQGVVGHHIKTRGSGGGDVIENLIGLCPVHHQEIRAIGHDTFCEKYGVEE